MRAVVQLLTGRNAGRRYAVANAATCSFDDEEVTAGGPVFALGPQGWTVLANNDLRVNGRLVASTLLRDRDILGYRGRLYRFHLLDAPGSPEVTPREAPTARRFDAVAQPPSRSIVPQSSPPPSAASASLRLPAATPRRAASGLSTVVTAPGRWGDVAGRWYDDAVFRISGVEHRPEELLGRLHRRMRCYLVLGASEPTDGRFETRSGRLHLGNVQLKSLAADDSVDAPLIRRLWNDRRLITLMSPLEADVLAQRISRFVPLLDRPDALAPLLRLPERTLMQTLREADAALLFGRPEGWELFCCPEMLPAWRRLGLPAESDGSPHWDFETIECPSGLVHFRGAVDRVRPAEVAGALAQRHSLYVLIDDAAAGRLPAHIPAIPLPATPTGFPLLVTPKVEDARFELIDMFWGEGVLALVTGRSDREVVDLLSNIPHWRSTPWQLARELAVGSCRNGLGGFEAVLLDAGDGGWSVFGDPRPVPVWRRYGLPSPVIEH